MLVMIVNYWSETFVPLLIKPALKSEYEVIGLESGHIPTYVPLICRRVNSMQDMELLINNLREDRNIPEGAIPILAAAVLPNRFVSCIPKEFKFDFDRNGLEMHIECLDRNNKLAIWKSPFLSKFTTGKSITMTAVAEAVALAIVADQNVY